MIDDGPDREELDFSTAVVQGNDNPAATAPHFNPPRGSMIKAEAEKIEAPEILPEKDDGFDDPDSESDDRVVEVPVDSPPVKDAGTDGPERKPEHEEVVLKAAFLFTNDVFEPEVVDAISLASLVSSVAHSSFLSFISRACSSTTINHERR